MTRIVDGVRWLLGIYRDPPPPAFRNPAWTPMPFHREEMVAGRLQHYGEEHA